MTLWFLSEMPCCLIVAGDHWSLCITRDLGRSLYTSLPHSRQQEGSQTLEMILLLNLEKNNVDESALVLLPKEEQHKIKRMVHLQDRQRSLVGQLMLRSLLWSRYPSTTIYRLHGRPECDMDCDFNVSHHSNWICSIISFESQARVGVDVVKIENPYQQDWHAFIHPFLSSYSDNELQWLEEPIDLDGRLERFYCLWVLKECIVKAIGTGIVTDLKAHYFQISHTETESKLYLEEIWYLEYCGPQKMDNYRFTVQYLDSNHLFGYCTNGKEEQEIQMVEFQSLVESVKRIMD